ncbi:MAG: transposase, partial [Desulfobulbaceae bacterium]|nr:transposase [Desulfobulbaceae bacterium]
MPIIEGQSVKRVHSLTEVFDDNENKIKQDQKRYSQQYKTESLALAEKIGVPTAARQLELHESQLYSWRSKARLAQDRSAVEERLLVENARLKRQVAEQAEELA